MRCTRCGGQNREGRNFCAQCGHPLMQACRSCGAQNDPADKFCGDCGAAIAGRSESLPDPRDGGALINPGAPDVVDAQEGERKTVTAMFADIQGSTELERALDPEDARAIIDPALKLMIDAVHRYDGYIVQSTGDGVFALFGAPVAHEDHPQRALFAAIKMHDEMRRYGDRLRAEGRTPIQIRVGANTGEVVVRSIATGSQVEYTPIGYTNNLASRLQMLANAGTTVISGSTQKLVEGYFALKPLGPARLKGVEEPVEVYEVTGLGPLKTKLQRAAGRGFSKFVGRQPEMDAIARAAELARSGHGQILAAVAEPGVGKSRLLYEFKVRNQGGFAVMEAFSVSHGRANPYAPVIDLLSSYFGFEPSDDTRKRREKVIGRILALDRALEDTLPHLCALLGIGDSDDSPGRADSSDRKRRTLDAIRAIMLRESVNQPLMVIFEDLHWIDNETQSLLNMLAESIGTARILLLVNYRPEYQHEWGSHASYTQLRLEPLAPESAAELLTTLVGDTAEVQPLRRMIMDTSGGNPFFIEETVQTLLEQGVIVRNGRVQVTKSPAHLRIPPTVQAILASRVDRLPARLKQLLQTLAVIGKHFHLGLVREITPQSDEVLNPMLTELEEREFIFEELGADDLGFTFKHALSLEVVYNSIVIERRKTLHEKIAQAIESLYADRIDDHVNELAHHYQNSANNSLALKYLSIAGERASNKSAYQEAGPLILAALEHLKKLPESPERDRKELQLQIALGPAMMEGEGDSSLKTRDAYSRIEELAIRLGEEKEELVAQNGLFLHHMVRSENICALKIATRFLERAKTFGSRRVLILANADMACGLYWSGKLALARPYFEQTFALADPGKDLSARSTGMDFTTGVSGYATKLLWMLGYPDQGLERIRIMFAAARALGHLSNSVMALHHGAAGYNLRREPETAMKYAEEGRALASANEFRLWQGLSLLQVGSALVQLRKYEEGIAKLNEGAAIVAEQGMPGGQPSVTAFALGKTGLRDKGLCLIDAALATGRQGGQTLPESELYLTQGELLLMAPHPDPAAAEHSFRTAIAISREQSAKSWELRATMSLARLLADHSKRKEAVTELSEIYGWFTEGFDTADLKDAKILLDELSRSS
jgi:class 3 adenylate cyclase